MAKKAKNGKKTAKAAGPEIPIPQDIGPGGNGSDEPPLTVHGQYIKDFSFENPGAPESLAKLQDAPDVDINVNVEARQLSGSDYEVVLTIAADAKDGDTTVFVVELVYGGVFGLSNAIPEEHKGPVLLIECPRILFPFARNVIADATRDGGFPPLLLQPIDFMAIYQEQMGQEDQPAAQA
ncbi:MAG: protein-export chaperone SecB [Pseudomonadota bacterium]